MDLRIYTSFICSVHVSGVSTFVRLVALSLVVWVVGSGYWVLGTPVPPASCVQTQT